MRVKRGRRKKPVVFRLFAFLVIVVGAALSIAYIWQRAQDSIEKKPASVPATEIDTESQQNMVDLESAIESAMQEEAVSQEEPYSSQEESSQEEALPEPTETAAYARDALKGTVALSETVEYAYFDDAIFFGDSISTGIPLYMKTTVPNTAVVAKTGISPYSANDPQQFEKDGPYVTMLEKAKDFGARKKVYIMLGANGLDLQQADFIAGYKAFVQSVKEQYPDSIIYVQSMLPVTRNVNAVYTDPNVNNARIEEYNAAILTLCNEQRVNYVDAAQAVVDADGYLPTEASPLDGMHLTPEYYIKWFDYLRCHTVKK